MKFKFPFDKLLKHRQNLEEMARKEFMLVRAKADDAEKELQSMYDVISDSRSRAGNLTAQGGTQGAALVQIDEFINGQKVRIHHQRDKIRQILMEVEQKQAQLVEAARERKTLEKLKERRLEEFKADMKKREMKEIDDIVTTRFKKEGF